MSKVIPFLEMFSALGRWTELASAVEPWQITAVEPNPTPRRSTPRSTYRLAAA